MIIDVVCMISKLLCGTAMTWRCDPMSDKPRVYFSNHTSHLDFLKIFAAMPERQRKKVHPVAAEEYWSETAFKKYISLKILNSVLVPRRPSYHRNDFMQPLFDVLNSGDSLIIFPEGTRCTDGKLHRFKKGLFRIWKECPNVEFVPVYLDNLNRILPKGELLPAPLISSVIFGEPYKPASDISAADFLVEAHKAVITLSDGSLKSAL